MKNIVITVIKDNERKATIQYRMQGFWEVSRSAIEKAKELLDYLLEEKNRSLDPRLVCLRFCLKNCGCIEGGAEETEYIRSIFLKERLKDHYYTEDGGAIALSKERMNEHQRSSNGDVYIDLDSCVVSFQANERYDSLEELNTYYEDYVRQDGFKPYTEGDDRIRHMDFCLEEFSFEYIDDAVGCVPCRRDTVDHVYESDGYYYEFY